MICRLFAALVHIDWCAPLTAEPHGGGPALDRALDRPIERHARRIGEYFPNGEVPR